MSRQGAAQSRSVSASSRSRSSCPAAVSSPSASSNPRSRRLSWAAAHSSSDHIRSALAASTRNPRWVAVWVTSASIPDSSACTSMAMCPSPRCSRSRVMACQKIRCGSVGHSRPACPANSGRPSMVQFKAACLAIPAAASSSSEPITSSPSNLRSVRSATRQRAASTCAGVARVQARGMCRAINCGIEVVEGGGNDGRTDLAHRRAAGGEISHPSGPQASGHVLLVTLGREVHARMQGVGRAEDATGPVQ